MFQYLTKEVKEIYFLHRRVFKTLLWDLPRWAFAYLGRRRGA